MLSLAGAACLWSVGAVGQAKIAWSDSCSKPDPAYEVKVGDPASHSLGLAQVKCHATKPAEIGGDKSKEAVSTYAYDQSGDKSREHGIYMLSLESGDKVSLPYLGTITLKDGKGIGARGTWGFGEAQRNQGERHLALLPHPGRWIQLQRRGRVRAREVAAEIAHSGG
jgi:hypothetical protein